VRRKPRVKIQVRILFTRISDNGNQIEEKFKKPDRIPRKIPVVFFFSL
jgi:hypothetical protein